MDTLASIPSDPLAALLLAFIAGLLSVATPCVLPMVPITLGTIGITKAATRGRAILTAAAYMAGIVLMFTALGTAFALSGRALGSLLGSPVTAVALAAVFCALALASFGAFELRLPSSVLGAFSRLGGQGPIGAFAAGLVAGFIAVPCIGPVLAGILSYVATTRNALFGAALLASYGIGFGLPFLAVGAMAMRLPKSGPWMQAVKAVFGLALLAGAFWFLRGAFPALRGPRAYVPGIALLLVGGATMIVVAAESVRSKASRLLYPCMIAAAFAGSALLMNHALRAHLRWCQESPQASCMPRTCESHRRTIVVFGAEWCGYCHRLETTTLADPRVVERLRNYGTVHVDIDENQELARSARLSGVPTIVVLDGECHAVLRTEGYLDPEDFLRFLDAAESR